VICSPMGRGKEDNGAGGAAEGTVVAGVELGSDECLGEGVLVNTCFQLRVARELGRTAFTTIPPNPRAMKIRGRFLNAYSRMSTFLLPRTDM
jgi:hypothetical protein